MVAPATNIKRPLRFWEQICSNMGVTMGFELEGKITPKMVKDAFITLQKEFPYLRTVLKQDMNQLAFVEQPVVCRSSPGVFKYTSCLIYIPTSKPTN